MKRRNTESSMQLALQATSSNDTESEIFWVSECCPSYNQNEDATPWVPHILWVPRTRKRHGFDTTRNKRNRPRNSSDHGHALYELIRKHKQKQQQHVYTTYARHSTHTQNRIYTRTWIQLSLITKEKKEKDASRTAPGIKVKKKKKQKKKICQDKSRRAANWSCDC